MTEAEARAALRGETEYLERLVRGLRAAAPEAHAELCDHFGATIHRYLAHRLGERDDVTEDLMVQTLEEAVRIAVPLLR